MAVSYYGFLAELQKLISYPNFEEGQNGTLHVENVLHAIQLHHHGCSCCVCCCLISAELTSVSEAKTAGMDLQH